MMITADFAGVPVGVGLSYDSYRKFFEAQQTEAAPAASVIVGEADRRRAAGFYPAGSTDAYIEYMELCRRVSDVLIPFRRAVFHGCAFIWRGRVVLLCAPSGTGKTTHYVRWKQLFGDEIQILNGDKPVLFARQEGDITVHPSPWHGKEGMGQPISAPLGGIVFLRKAAENTIRRVGAELSAGILFRQFIFSSETVEAARGVAEMEDILLRSVSVWELANRGDAAAACLCHDTLEKEWEPK